MKTTILSTDDGKLLTKRFTKTPDGWTVQAYDHAFTFNVLEHDVDDISDLSMLLTAMEDMPHSCLIRGSLKRGMSPDHVKRRIIDQDGEIAAFEEAPKGVQWLMIDFDKVPAPSSTMTQQERLDHLVSLLPKEFHDVSYHYQWSSSSGLYGWDTLSAHLWFWLDRPHRCSRLRQRAVHQGWEIDESTINAAQIHYTASPIFTNAIDPIDGKRSGLVPRVLDEVALPAWHPPVVQAVPGQSFSTPSTTFETLLEDIGPRYHGPIRRVIASYIARHGWEADTWALKQAIRDRIFIAPPGASRKADYTSDAYLDASIRGAQRKFASAVVFNPVPAAPSRAALVGALNRLRKGK